VLDARAPPLPVDVGEVDGHPEDMKNSACSTLALRGAGVNVDVEEARSVTADPCASECAHHRMKCIKLRQRSGREPRMFCRPGAPMSQSPRVDYQTHPSRYRHWTLKFEGAVCTLLADFDDYVACQQKVDEAYRDPEHWTRMSILNSARSGVFSSDRTIHEYASHIWSVEPVKVKLLTREDVRGGFLQ
jgi:hypothetical protein